MDDRSSCICFFPLPAKQSSLACIPGPLANPPPQEAGRAPKHADPIGQLRRNIEEGCAGHCHPAQPWRPFWLHGVLKGLRLEAGWLGSWLPAAGARGPPPGPGKVRAPGPPQGHSEHAPVRPFLSLLLGLFLPVMAAPLPLYLLGPCCPGHGDPSLAPEHIHLFHTEFQ